MIIKKIFSSQIFISLLGLAILALVCVPLYKNYKQRHIINQEMNELADEIDRIKTKNDELQNMIGYLKSDQFIEEQARLNLGLKKNGEEVVIVKKADTASPEAIDPKQSNPIFTIPGMEVEAKKNKFGNAGKWWGYFF